MIMVSDVDNGYYGSCCNNYNDILNVNNNNRINGKNNGYINS
jgi:hypothetical protein